MGLTEDPLPDPGGPRPDTARLTQRGGALARPCVQNDLMALVDERPRSRTAQAIGAAGDEDVSPGATESFQFGNRHARGSDIPR